MKIITLFIFVGLTFGCASNNTVSINDGELCSYSDSTVKTKYPKVEIVCDWNNEFSIWEPAYIYYSDLQVKENIKESVYFHYDKTMSTESLSQSEIDYDKPRQSKNEELFYNSGNLKSRVYSFKSTDGSFIITGRKLFLEYDADRVLLDESYSWNSNANKWELISKNEYSYDKNNFLIRIVSSDWSESMARTEIEKNSENEIVEYIYLDSKENKGSLPQLRHIKHYENNLLIYMTGEKLKNGKWIKERKWIYRNGSS